MTVTESMADLVITHQKAIGKALFDDLARQLSEYDKIFPKCSVDVNLPILKPDKAMTVKQVIEKLSALDGDLKIYVRYDAGYDSGGGTWIDDVTNSDKYEILDMESHVVIDVS